MMSLTLAIMTQVAAVVTRASTSLARRRLRLSQAKVRSSTGAAGQQHEVLGAVGTLDDLDGSGAEGLERCRELLAGIAAIGEEVADTAGAGKR